MAQELRKPSISYKPDRRSSATTDANLLFLSEEGMKKKDKSNAKTTKRVKIQIDKENIDSVCYLNIIILLGEQYDTCTEVNF